MVVDHTRSSVLFRASASSERVSGQVLHFTAQGPYQAVSLARASQLPDRLHPLFVFSRTLSRALPVALALPPLPPPFPRKNGKQPVHTADADMWRRPTLVTSPCFWNVVFWLSRRRIPIHVCRRHGSRSVICEEGEEGEDKGYPLGVRRSRGCGTGGLAFRLGEGACKTQGESD